MNTEAMACPECGTVNPMIGVVNDTRQYLCRACGQVYYTPDSCLRSPAPAPRTIPRGSPASTAAPPQERSGEDRSPAPAAKEGTQGTEPDRRPTEDREPSGSPEPAPREDRDPPEEP